MNESEIDAHKVSVKQLLELNLAIPHYQRPYRWTSENVEQLLSDINNARLNCKRDYLIGSVILHRNNNLDIVDGQQRITTICLILKALHNHIPDIIDTPRLPTLTFNHSDSFSHIKENFNWICKNLPQEAPAEFYKYLLTNCKVVQIIVNQLPEAFQLFETQNSRGKSLEAYNLLKAYHIRAMSDNTTQEKINCDVRWEDAAIFHAADGQTHDILRQVINEHLFRCRVWSRGETAGKFSRQEVKEFKGVTIGKNCTIDYAYQNVLLQQQIASAFMQNLNMGLFKVKSRFEHGDPENMSPFVNINQLIVNGMPFFDYIETYIEIYKRLFIQSETSQLHEFKRFYHKYCKNYHGWWRSGDGYIRQAYKSAIIAVFDKFGEKGVESIYVDLYICFYIIRLESSQVRYATVAKSSSNIFTVIHNAKNLAELWKIKKIAQDKEHGFDNNSTKYFEKFKPFFKQLIDEFRAFTK